MIGQFSLYAVSVVALVAEVAYAQPPQNTAELTYGDLPQNTIQLTYAQLPQNFTELAYVQPSQNITESAYSAPPDNMVSSYSGEIPFVVGGENAAYGEFPYQVSLRYQGQHICGGSIITRRHILTAAHCFKNLVSLNNLVVVTGAISLSSGGQSHRPRIITYPSGYTGTATGPHDIAIIVLTASINFNAYQNVIPMASTLAPTGASATITGWGYPSITMPRPTERLKKLRANIIRAGDCQRRSDWQLNTHQICAFSQAGRGACLGDSGGPLVVSNILVGVVSYGSPCARGRPDVYTSVYHYRSWILYVTSTT